jgi:D-alanyl-D-alanine carboxypeptidase
MGWASAGARQGLRGCVLGLTAIGAILIVSSNAADARHHHHLHAHLVRHSEHLRHHASSEDYTPPSASILVDGNNGAGIEESNADGLRHPASLTKVMTLYLLFERLDSGRIGLDTQLSVSERAAEQSPTKLGLKPGQTISVEDAIKGVVTRSANDAAVVIAENLGGSEEAFAQVMTQKAHALGMSRTTYVNASGLPDDDQVTTARDQALLGRAIQDRFPRYYRFFSTTSFVFHGVTIHGHNHLLGSVNGVDGIKTGYIRASGFNLITSVHRDGRYIVGVVLGGRSAFERDAHMRALIESNIRLASTQRSGPVIAERAMPKSEPQQVALAKPAPARAEPTANTATTAHASVGSSDPIRPLLVRTVTYHTVTVRTASMVPMPVLVPVAPAPQPQAEAPTVHAYLASADPTVVPVANPPAPKTESKAEPVLTAQPIKTVPVKSANAAPEAAPHAHGGWIIQIGAFDSEDEARQHLGDAKQKVHGALSSAEPFTERVQKSDKALYRARFAGFDKDTAEAACKQLKRSDFACIAVKD